MYFSPFFKYFFLKYWESFKKMNSSFKNWPKSLIIIILKSFIFELKLKEKRWKFALIKKILSHVYLFYFPFFLSIKCDRSLSLIFIMNGYFVLFWVFDFIFACARCRLNYLIYFIIFCIFSDLVKSRVAFKGRCSIFKICRIQ